MAAFCPEKTLLPFTSASHQPIFCPEGDRAETGSQHGRMTGLGLATLLAALLLAALLLAAAAAVVVFEAARLSRAVSSTS